MAASKQAAGTRLGHHSAPAALSLARPSRARADGCNGQQRQPAGGCQIQGYLKHNGVERDLVYDLSVTHERWGATDEPCKNRQLCYPDDINRPLQEEAAQKKVLEYQNAYANATTQQAHVSRRAHGANRDSIGRTALRREATAPGKCKSIRYGCGKDAPADELCVR